MPTETMPKVSAFVITYNQERYIRAALEGILAQETTFPFEVVIGDDASTDGTRNIIEEFAARYPDQVRLSCRENNPGDEGIENILLGLEMCRGEYIATIDGDDYWTDSGKLQRQADLLDAHPDYPMCFHNCRLEYEEGDRQSWDLCQPLQRDSVTAEDLLEQKAAVQTSTIMMRRKLASELRDWPPELLNDWFVGLVASRSGPIGYIDRVMSVYRQHPSSYFSSLSRADQWAEFITRLKNVYRQPEEMLGKPFHDAIGQAICVRSYLAAAEYEKERDFANARKFLSLALEGRPAWLEPYCVEYGLTGVRLRRKLTRRLRLYRFPPLFGLSLRFDRMITETRWHWLDAVVQTRSKVRLKLGAPVGFIIASPNPAPSSARNVGLVSVALEWAAAGTEAVEVRLGRPDGPLISHANAAGRTETGEWVSDGTVFYLQNVFGTLPLTRNNTLDVVRVKVKE